MEKRVRDLMTAEPVTVAPEATLREVAEALSVEHVSGVPVVTSGGRVVGVVSAADLMNFLAASPRPEPEPGDFAEWEREVERAEAEPESMSTFFSGWEAGAAELSVLFAEAGGEERDVLRGHTVDEVMTRSLLTVGPDAPAAEAARLMLEHNVHRLLVIDSGRLEGVITTRDLLHLIAASTGAAGPDGPEG